MRKRFCAAALALTAALSAGLLTGCSSASGGETMIVRIGHNQSTNHPTHIALAAFEEFIESRLGDKYDVEVFPSELLGSQNEMVQLTQTGAINFCKPSARTTLCLIFPICFLPAKPTMRPWMILPSRNPSLNQPDKLVLRLLPGWMQAPGISIR